MSPASVRAIALEFADAIASAAGPVLPVVRGLDGTDAIDYGGDGRLTFLLLGSDSRHGAIDRTDTILVMSLEGSTISAASIPRDTKRIPNPFDGGTYGKVNSILRSLYVANRLDLDVALAKFEVVVEETLGIEIDYHALIWFEGFTTLLDQVDGDSRRISVSTGRGIYDSTHHDEPGSQSYGVYFPSAANYELYAQNPTGQTGSPYCDGTFKKYADPARHPQTWCHRALPFVRSRHGSSDWSRAKRQQRFVEATIDAVDYGELAGLFSTAIRQEQGKWWTNFPMTMENVIDLYNALQGSSLANTAVFAPARFATRIGLTNGYELNLSTVRAWCDAYMS